MWYPTGGEGGEGLGCGIVFETLPYWASAHRDLFKPHLCNSDGQFRRLRFY